MATVTPYQPKHITPTDEQVAVQMSAERTLIIEANAGAAKTTTLALRMAQAWTTGMPPERCLALTYTDTACQALQAALRKIGVPAPVVARFRIASFDAFCAAMLQEPYGPPVEQIDTQEALRPYVWEAVQRIEANESERWPEELQLPSAGDAGFVEDFLAMALWLKGTLKDDLERDDGPATPDYAGDLGIGYTQLKVFRAYERIRRRELADEPLFRGPYDATYDLARRLLEGDTAASLAMGLGSLIVGIAAAFVRVPFFAWLYEHRVADLGAHAWSWPVLLFAEDLCYSCCLLYLSDSADD